MTDPTDTTDITDTRSDSGQTDSNDRVAEVPALDTWQTTPDTQFGDVPGLAAEKQRLRETVIASMESGRSVRANTVLLYGEGDAGVTDLADALTSELANEGCDVFDIPLHSDRHERVAAPLGNYIEQARDTQPCVLRVDQISHANLSVGSRTRAAIEQLDATAPRVALVATATIWDERRRDILDTNLTEWLDVCLRINPPDAPRRRAIVRNALESLCAEHNIAFDAAAIDFETALEDLAADSVDVLRTVAKRAIIRVETDAAATACKTAHLAAAARNVADEWNCQQRGRDNSRAEQDLDGMMTPTVPDVSFADVGGLNDVKQRIRELLLYPREYEALFERTGVNPAHGVVLYGPPGTGKTLLAKAVANATDRSFLAVEGPELKSMWFGQTEAHIREVFALADEHAPSVVFFDEFDAIAGTRSEFTHEVNSSVVTTLLAELDGLENRDDVLFLAATNRPDALDPAVTRAGRFGEAVEVPLPDREGCREIFAVHASDLPTAGAVTPAWFAEHVPEGVSGAEIASICERSLYEAIRDADEGDATVTVTRRHVTAAIGAVINDNETDDGQRAFA